MWKLKRMGFYIYLIGELLPYATAGFTKALSTMYASASMAGENGALAINIFIGCMIVFDITFIVLYAVNLKHLK